MFLVHKIRNAVITATWRARLRRMAGFVLAPLVIVLSVSLGHPLAVRAETIPYVISPGATFDVTHFGDTFGLSGTFDVDTVNPADSSADLVVTYGTNSETFTEVDYVASNQFGIEDPSNGDNLLSLQFYPGSDLASALPDPLQNVDLGINDGDNVLQATWSCCYWPGFPSAGSAADPAVPEPASLALLGSALAGLAAIRRRKRKAVCIPPPKAAFPEHLS